MAQILAKSATRHSADHVASHPEDEAIKSADERDAPIDGILGDLLPPNRTD